MVQPVNGITLTCAWEPCSKTFVAFPSQVKRTAKNYCSRVCAHLGNAVARTTRVALICAYPPCRKPFEVYAYKLKSPDTPRCCSRTCKTSFIMLRKYPGTFEEKFWALVSIGAPDECWPWQGRTVPNGYGMIYVPETQTDTGAHIVAWYLAHRRWPLPGMNVCHSCDSPPCCNERHLWEGTALDNVHDSIAKGRNQRGERHHNSKLTNAQWQEVLALLAEGMLSQSRIAAQYGIHLSSLKSRLKHER